VLTWALASWSLPDIVVCHCRMFGNDDVAPASRVNRGGGGEQ